MFESKKKEETDNEFYENVKHLNAERNYKRNSNATITESISIKEECIFNNDMLNLINSPTVNFLVTFRKQGNNQGNNQIFHLSFLMMVFQLRTEEYQ